MIETRKLSRMTMISFGIGNSAEGIKSTAFGTFLLFYYQQVLGVSGTLTGLALAISLVADAITDPIVGHISDNSRSRWGRRHVFIAGAAIPLGLCFFLLFSPPDGLSELGNFLWLLVFAVSARVAMTFYDIPHLALGAEMAPSYKQRTSLFSISTWFRVASGAAVTYVAYRFLFPTSEQYNPGLLNPDGYFWLGLIFGLAMIFVLAVCVLGTRGEIPFLRKSDTSGAIFGMGFFREVAQTWKSRSFRYIFVGFFVYVLIVRIEQSLGTYVVLHFWGMDTELMSLLPLASLVGAFVAFPAVNMLGHWLEKRMMLILVTIIAVVNINVFVLGRLFFPDQFPENGSTAVIWLVLINYFFAGFISLAAVAMINSMYADVADDYEYITGKRREGLLYASRSFANKAAGAVGLFLGGVVLDLIDFPERAGVGDVSQETLWKLGFVYGPATSILMLGSIILYVRYDLTQKRVSDIQEQLRHRAVSEGAATGVDD